MSSDCVSHDHQIFDTKRLPDECLDRVFSCGCQIARLITPTMPICD